jgi:preprotein translocase subunit SecE
MAETVMQAPVIAGASEKKNLKDKTVGFFNDVAREMRKVSWPNREELQDATIIVLVACLVLSIFIFGIDKIFETLLRFIYHV